MSSKINRPVTPSVELSELYLYDMASVDEVEVLDEHDRFVYDAMKYIKHLESELSKAKE